MTVTSKRAFAFNTHRDMLMSATAIATLIMASSALSADVTITSGSTVGQQSINDGDTLIVEGGATVNSASPAVVDAVDGSTITINNDGTITSTADAAIDNRDSTLNLTNNGSISGALDGILTLNIGTLVNNADIVGSGGDGIYATGNTNQFTNTGSITSVGSFAFWGDGTLTNLTNNGLMTGPFGALYYDTIGTVTNSGTFSGGVDGIVTMGDFGSLTNNGLITGGSGTGIDVGGLLGYLSNTGTISGASAGVDAGDLGTVVNSGLITGEDGIYSNDNLVSLTNTGTISGTGVTCSCSTGSGVFVSNTAGSIINHGSITGVEFGLNVTDLTSLINSGSITGGNEDGVYLDGGTLGFLSNSGSITGGENGVLARTITTLTNTGSITGNGNNGIAAANLISLVNNGSITGDDDGIGVQFITNLINTGSITGDVDGVFAQTITSLTNSGAITAKNHDGIAAERLTSLINNGSITGGDDGIDVHYITDLINNGSITGQDEGVKASEITLLTNNGTITGGGASDESGIDADFGTIINNGLIQGGIGIEFDRKDDSDVTNPGNANVTNNGTIKSFSSTSGVAIDFQGMGADTLTLTRNSVLVGTVKWDGIDDTLNLAANTSSVIKFTNLPETTNTSSNFVIFDGTTLIQIDSSFLASLDDVVLGTSGSINNSVFNQLNDAIFGSSSISPQAYNPAEAEGITKFWNSNWFSYNELQTTNTLTTDYTRSLGSMFGVEKTIQHGTIYGAYAGLGLSQTKIGSTVLHNIDAHSYVAGIYSQFSKEHTDIDVNFQLGQIKFDSARQQTNNSVSSGLETASANFDSFYVAPNIRFSREITVDNGLSFIPSLALGYTGIYVEDYSETGSTANATIASRTIHQFQARAELGLRYDWTADNDVEYIFNPYAGLEGRMGSGDIDQVTGTIGSTSTTFNPGGDKNVGAIFAGMNVNAKLSESARFEGAAEAKIDSQNQFGFSASWGVKLKF